VIVSTLTDVSPIAAAQHPGQFALLMTLGVLQLFLMGVILWCFVRIAWILLKLWFRFMVEVMVLPLRLFNMFDRLAGDREVVRKPAQC
jgi:hypothetical protein